MSAVVVFCPRRGELSVILSTSQLLFRRMDLQVEPQCLDRFEGLRAYLEGNHHKLDCAICDVTIGQVLPLLELLRIHNPEMRLVLVADESVSPMQYIRPSILPMALLWRPLKRDEAAKILEEVYATLPNHPEGETQGADSVFSLEARGDRRFYAYREILFFESREKRLYLHTQREECPFAGTLEGLLERLPDQFVRVHKSFIVNRARVCEIRFGQNLLELEGGLTLPISRSYKAQLKAVFA